MSSICTCLSDQTTFMFHTYCPSQYFWISSKTVCWMYSSLYTRGLVQMLVYVFSQAWITVTSSMLCYVNALILGLLHYCFFFCLLYLENLTRKSVHLCVYSVVQIMRGGQGGPDPLCVQAGGDTTCKCPSLWFSFRTYLNSVKPTPESEALPKTRSEVQSESSFLFQKAL